MTERVLVAMSGGVDSSVTCIIVREFGYEPVGVTMQLWDYSKGSGGRTKRCCSVEDTYDARRVAVHLDVPHYVMNLEKMFHDVIVKPFIESYLSGKTPIPCVTCNSILKFDALVELADRLGCRYVATGHYVRLVQDVTTKRYLLQKARDLGKDQSYFLFELTQEQLARSLFPLGELTKDEVRSIARAHGLPVAQKPDSQQLCFVPDGNYRRFLQDELSDRELRKGFIMTLDGRVVGEHDGIHNFTIGQRKGIRIAFGQRMYVVDIDPGRNIVYVGPETALYTRTCLIEHVNWIIKPPKDPVRARVRIRYRHREMPAQLTPIGDKVIVTFDEPQRAITPGQAGVFYSEDGFLLGGGWITRQENKHLHPYEVRERVVVSG